MAEDKRILIIDDDAMVAHSLARVLIGWSVTTETSGQAAVNLCMDNDFDVIVCDLHMPNFNGADIYRALGDKAPQLQRRLIFLSGGAYTTWAREFLSEVKVPLLQKPYDFSEVMAMLSEIASRPK